MSCRWVTSSKIKKFSVSYVLLLLLPQRMKLRYSQVLLIYKARLLRKYYYVVVLAWWSSSAFDLVNGCKGESAVC